MKVKDPDAVDAGRLIRVLYDAVRSSRSKEGYICRTHTYPS